MDSRNTRFPKSVLFARAAQLHQELEKWMGHTAVELDHLERGRGDLARIKTLRERHESLRGAWLKLGEARREIIDTP